MYLRRLKTEYKKLMENPVDCVLAHPDPKNILKWYFVYYDLYDSPYEGGVYMGNLTFKDTYPHSPP
mgnify:CR=1 FL=1